MENFVRHQHLSQTRSYLAALTSKILRKSRFGKPSLSYRQAVQTCPPNFSSSKLLAACRAWKLIRPGQRVIQCGQKGFDAATVHTETVMSCQSARIQSRFGRCLQEAPATIQCLESRTPGLARHSRRAGILGRQPVSSRADALLSHSARGEQLFQCQVEAGVRESGIGIAECIAQRFMRNDHANHAMATADRFNPACAVPKRHPRRNSQSGAGAAAPAHERQGLFTLPGGRRWHGRSTARRWRRRRQRSCCRY